MPSAPSTRGPGTFGNLKGSGSRPGWTIHASFGGTSVDSALALLRADHPDIGAAIAVLECAVGKFRTPVPRGMPGGGSSGEVRPATF